MSSPRLRKLNWVSPKLKVNVTSWGERGLFTVEPVACGETLIVYGGHVIPISDFCCLPTHLQAYPYQIGEELFFGPMFDDEVAIEDFLNHSCNPNAGWKGEITLIAMRSIAREEQVTIDYAMCMSFDERTAELLSMQCSCGEHNCRKYISGKDWQIQNLQSRYKGYFQPYIERKIAQ